MKIINPGKIAIHILPRQHLVLGIAQHVAPGGRGRLDAETQVTKARLCDDRAGDAQGRGHDHRAERIGQGCGG